MGDLGTTGLWFVILRSNIRPHSFSRFILPPVAANAGIGDSVDFYGSLSSSGTPAKPNLRTIDVNLTAVLFTVYLAQHYLARNPAGGKITITASSAALYPIPFAPLYGASKSAVRLLRRTSVKFEKLTIIYRYRDSCDQWHRSYKNQTSPSTASVREWCQQH